MPAALAFTWLLLLLLTTQHAAVAAKGDNECFDEISFVEILKKVKRPSCLRDGKVGDCSLMSHVSSLAIDRNSSLDSMLQRVTVLVLAHSSFARDLASPDHPAIGVESTTEKHLAFFGLTKCLKGDDFCTRLRTNCRADTNSILFLITGHCSRRIRCDPVNDFDSTMLLGSIDFLTFRMLERQLFVASELGELRLGVSSSSEFLIQSELNETHSDSLVHSGQPLAMFISWPQNHIGYFHLFSMFVEAALSLKDTFDYHVVTSQLSAIANQNDRPAFRRSMEHHEAALGLFERSRCQPSNSWAFTCQPVVVKSDSLLTTDQFSSFLLHKTLEQFGVKGAPHPAFSSSNKYLKTLVATLDTFVMAIVPVEEMLTDTLIDWENLRTLTSYLSSTFSVSYYPLMLTKSVAVELLNEAGTGLNLEEALDGPCFLIRLPGGGGVTILRVDEPIMTLEKLLNSKDELVNGFRGRVQISQEFLANYQAVGASLQLVNTGHFAGGDGSYDLTKESKELLDDAWVEGRSDAFIEQLKFKEIYNVTGVKVVDTNDELMEKFFETAGYDKPWLVLFVVPWSPPCKAVRAIWSAVGDCVGEVGLLDVQLAKVDCFEANEICNELGIEAYPTVSVVSRGRIVTNYSGPLTKGGLCQFGSLALQTPALSAESKEETRRLIEKLLPLKSRVFVYEGRQMPQALINVAEQLHPTEVIVHHHRHESGTDESGRLTAFYSGVYPDTNEFKGAIDSEEEIKDFVLNGHLQLVFPCTWSYLPQALASTRPLVILFHLTTPEDNVDLLLRLRRKFGQTVSYSYLYLKESAHLKDAVEKIAGLLLPALVTFTTAPQGGRVAHRLPVGALAADELAPQACDWLAKALNHSLDGGRVLEPPAPWQPASRSYNFVDEVYHGSSSSSSEQSAKDEDPEESLKSQPDKAKVPPSEKESVASVKDEL